jgi:opacity protein-like surface antigen
MLEFPENDELFCARRIRGRRTVSAVRHVGRIVMMRIVLVALGFAAVFGVDLARAAEFGPLPANTEAATQSWTGCYAGPELGGIVSGGTSGAGVGLAATIGGLAGCNYHSGHAVFGAEGEIMWSNLSANSDTASGGLFPSSSFATTRNQWDGDIAARVGYLFRYDVLSYLKIGAAFGDYKFTTTTTTFPFPATLTSGGLWMAGLLLGGGAELMLSPHWFARGEFDVVLFSPKDATLNCTPTVFCTSGATLSTQAEAQFHAKIGVTYRFM